MKVGYAYPGFVYLPLFLAKSRDYLSKTTKLLECANGDSETLDQLLNINHSDQADLVLCDPLVLERDVAEHISADVGPQERPVVVASVIRNTPVWVYTCANIDRAMTESALREKLTTIKCYKSPNTGYLIARRLQQISQTTGSLKEIDFGVDDFSVRAAGEALVTSNILQISKHSKSAAGGKVIFSYPSRETDIKGMFFTGVLTGAFPISRSRAHTHRRHGHPLQTVPSAGLIERPQEKNRVDALR